MLLEANLADLQRHANDSAYLSRSHDAGVSSWIRADQADLDVPLYEAVTAWLSTHWPFGGLTYHPR